MSPRSAGPDAALPMMIRLAGARCAVIGAGPVGTRRARRLGEHGAEVIVVSPEISEEMSTLHAAGTVDGVHQRPYAVGDLDGCLLAVAATSDRAVNAAVARDARAAGILCNVADAPDEGNVTMPASATRGRLTLSVATAGASPVASVVARDRALEALAPGWEAALDHLAALRPRLSDAYPDPAERREAVERLLSPATLAALASDGDVGVAESALGLAP